MTYTHDIDRAKHSDAPVGNVSTISIKARQHKARREQRVVRAERAKESQSVSYETKHRGGHMHGGQELDHLAVNQINSGSLIAIRTMT